MWSSGTGGFFLPSCSVSGALTTTQEHYGASLCAQGGGESVSEVMGWASVVVGSAAQVASTATLLQDSSYINMSIHSGDRQSHLMPVAHQPNPHL